MKTLKLIWKNKDLRNKLLIVIAILFGIRILSGIPTPGVNRNYFKLLLAQNSTLNFFNAISGNGLSNLSIMALSITPYITASIIIQLLGVIFPQVKELQQCKTKADKRKYEWILVFSGAGLACLESLTMAIGFGRKGLLTKYKWYYVLLITVIWTIMATLTSIIGKIISVKLVGNGISLILVSNILSSYPSDSANIYEVLMKGKKTYIAGLHLFFLLILITALFIFTVWLQDTEKKIPVTYSGKLQGKSTFKGVSTNTIPIKLCPGGVVPIIFASSLISFPILIAQIAGAKQNAVLKLLNSGYWFNTSKPWYTFGALIYLVLIFAFSYFYTEITMNPEEIANNIKKSGGNIAGIRAGSSTAEYLRKQMKYLIAIGSFCLCIIAIIPFIVSGLTGLSRLSFFGTSIIITVSVILETKKLILSKTQENYYMNRVKKGLVIKSRPFLFFSETYILIIERNYRRKGGKIKCLSRNI